MSQILLYGIIVQFQQNQKNINNTFCESIYSKWVWNNVLSAIHFLATPYLSWSHLRYETLDYIVCLALYKLLQPILNLQKLKAQRMQLLRDKQKQEPFAIQWFAGIGNSASKVP